MSALSAVRAVIESLQVVPLHAGGSSVHVLTETVEALLVVLGGIVLLVRLFGLFHERRHDSGGGPRRSDPDGESPSVEERRAERRETR